jgi:hypothetical protein
MPLPTKSVLSIAFLAVSLMLFGCDSSGTNGEPENEAPTADVSVTPGTTVDVGQEITLDGSVSSDPDQDELSFSWTLATPEGSSAELSDSGAEQPTFTPDVGGDYTASLEVSDGEETDTDNATITAEATTVEISSNVTSDRTLTPENRYLVTANCVGIEDGATLTIEAGVHMEFEANTCIRINGNNAALVASGTESDPITMVGTESDPEGWWQGVASYSTNPNNELNYVVIEDAGSSGWAYMNDQAASVAINDDNQLTVTNSTIRNGGGFGLHVQEAAGDLTFSGNTFSGNQTAPVNVPFTLIGEIDAASNFEDDTFVRIWDANPNSGDVTIDALNVPYRITNNPGLDGDVSVTIDPGVKMEFTANSSLQVNSDNASLVVNGESDNEVVMTATPDNQNAGFWQGVAIYSNNPTNEISHATIEYAGSSSWGYMSSSANIGIQDGAQLTLNSSTITDSGEHGVHCDGSNAAFTTDGNNSYSNNAGNNVNGCNTN